MKVSVIGGGVSGCLSALAFNDLGFDVDVYEAGTELGGIHRDIVTSAGVFFQNCQYFNAGSDALAIASKIQGVEFVSFEHKYGSVNNFFGKNIVHDNFAQIVVPGDANFKFVDVDKEMVSVSDRLSNYECFVAAELFEWAARYGDPAKLDAGNCHHMQLGRVFYRDVPKYVAAEKARSILANDLLGLPRDCLEPPLPMQCAALPINGYNHFFKMVHAEFLRRGIGVHFSSPVAPTMKGGCLKLYIRKDEVKADFSVWCANPVSLARIVLGETLDSPVIRAFNIVADIDGVFPDFPVYYQSFCKDLPFTRVFKYHIDGHKVTFEGFESNNKEVDLLACAQLLLDRLGWDCRIKNAAYYPQKRYVLLTVEDRRRLDMLSSLVEQYTVVPGGWQFYGRDAKISAIKESFDRVVGL